MSAVFTSTIKMNEKNGWHIEIKDILSDEVVICSDVDDYSIKVEELGNKYGGRIDSVEWHKDEDVPPHYMDELRFQMAKYQEEHKEELDNEKTI